MAYYIYILESEKDGTHYIGSSRDPEKGWRSITSPTMDIQAGSSLGNWFILNSTSRKVKLFSGKSF
jgi:hypothetical protein